MALTLATAIAVPGLGKSTTKRCTEIIPSLPELSTKAAIRICYRHNQNGRVPAGTCLSKDKLLSYLKDFPKEDLSGSSCTVYEEREYCKTVLASDTRAGNCPPPQLHIVSINLDYTALSNTFFGLENQDDIDRYGNSLGLSLERILRPNMAIELAYSSYDFDTAILDQSLSLDLKLYLGRSPNRYYLSGGLGIYDFEIEGEELGFQLGLGYQRDLNDRVLLDLSARHLSTENLETSVDFTSLRLGLGFRF